VLWIARTGAPWRDLPAPFGNWNSVFQRFRRWARKGVFECVFEALRGDPDFEYVIADGTISRVHQKATGAKGGHSAKPLGARVVA
jgi:transposase